MGRTHFGFVIVIFAVDQSYLRLLRLVLLFFSYVVVVTFLRLVVVFVACLVAFTLAIIFAARLELFLKILDLSDFVLLGARLLLADELDLGSPCQPERRGVLFEWQRRYVERRLVFLKVDGSDVGNESLRRSREDAPNSCQYASRR